MGIRAYPRRFALINRGWGFGPSPYSQEIKIRFDYKCDSCKEIREFREKIGTGNVPKPCECGGVFNKIPHTRMVIHYKATGFTKVSSDEGNFRRKLSPWFGGPQENAPDYDATVEYNESIEKADRIERQFGPDSALDIRNSANKNLEKAASEVGLDMMR